ncbi:Similar to lrrc6: Protein tilB homolog (Danio rerio) [Cotesia congregata]|uniref:Similar to lrrc6: Protein tilB homolog (Danio rerio) n=1 Tax=Cotesia congregata TaxID=51543 RepID=A0A8J2H772_COTCN|nr:Similar to lrrc6: Protein tilB homolog (Danio rerio) [Cotesia congregata]
MVRITVDLIRKRSEHNEGEISTLEEIALHQENIEKIELIDKLSRNLKILLMQNNIISKIENLNMLKKLEYLNLAINNIEVIENLEGLESLIKLDLTVNFIGDLRGVKKLRCNEHLKELFLTGNPCTEYLGYRDYVIATLPQLKELDMTEITRSDRIKALQRYAEIEGDVIRGYWDYCKIRKKQIDSFNQREKLMITEVPSGLQGANEEYQDQDQDQDDNSKFWNSKSYHTPEDRVAIANKTLEIAEKKNKKKDNKLEKKKYIPKLFNSEGRAYNINQAKVSFTLNDDDRDNIVLEISLYRHLDTSYVDIDVQPNYVRATIKGKILQLSLPCEVSTDSSVAKRNVATGNLVVTMPRLAPLPSLVKPLSYATESCNNQRSSKIVRSAPVVSRREFLEIGPRNEEMDFSKIYKENISNDKHRTDFIDDPDVPPLE